MRGVGALLPCLMLALSGCSSGAAAPTVHNDGSRAAQLEQEQLAARALAGLDRRVCDAGVGLTVLEKLPRKPLPCLGTGPARAPSAGDGRPTLVNLWASWCRPCLEEMPLLQRAAATSGTRVRFVGIDTEDERDSAAGMLDATGVTYEQYADPGAIVRAATRAPGLPATLVFDARGRLVAKRIGKVDAAWLRTALASARG